MISDRLKIARKAQGLTQAQLAERAHVDQAFISRVERGHKQPSLGLLQTLARELRVTVSYLLGEETAEDKDKHPPKPRGPELVLADHTAPSGLREFAQDRALVTALKVSEEEWAALRSIQLPAEASKDGYAQLLITVRTVAGR